MGSSACEQGHEKNEEIHPVELTEGFWIAETPTTQQLWQAVMGDNPSLFKGEQLPVERVSWYDCQEFVKKLNAIYGDSLPSGYKYAFPTEAQWEYACRAGTSTPFSFGDSLNGDSANCLGLLAYGTQTEGVYKKTTTPVKSYEPNSWGLYDMHGNVSEWCADWYEEDFVRTYAATIDPVGPMNGSLRVLHGGSWQYAAKYCRAASRRHAEPGRRGVDFGFRLVLAPQSHLQVQYFDDVTAEREYVQVDEPEVMPEAGELKTIEIRELDVKSRWTEVSVNFHWAPAGAFQVMPSRSGEQAENDQSRGVIELTRGFWIAETETTQELWQLVMGNNPSRFIGEQLPVENVNFYDCQSFVQKLNEKHRKALPRGYKFAMPTEAQWEYACRAGSATPFKLNATSDGVADNANMPYTKGNGDKPLWKTTPVKSYDPNAWGLYDMNGNVYEWTSDWFDVDYYSIASSRKDPTGPISGSNHVLCIASWFRDGGVMLREGQESGYRRDYHGFRLAIVQDSQPVRQYPDGEEPEATREAGAIKTLRVNEVPVNFHWSPAGTFLMGDPEDGENYGSNNYPHHVMLTKGFWIAETETTQELWQAVMDDNPSCFKGELLPVEDVTWDDCQVFIDKLNSVYRSALPRGYKFALPTEAQWEYACRAGTKTTYNFGETYHSEEANLNLASTTYVKSYAPNLWGLYDMHGNVEEWCADWYAPYDKVARSTITIDPTGSDALSDSDRRKPVVRGGSWGGYYYVSSSHRSLGGMGSSERRNDRGFRLVLVPDGGDSVGTLSSESIETDTSQSSQKDSVASARHSLGYEDYALLRLDASYYA